MNNESTNHLGARNPHKAIVAHVNEFGSDDSQALYNLAAIYDRVFFAGSLGQVFVEIGSPGSPRALATHEARTPEGVACKVRIAPSVVDASPELAADALLHEMVHMWTTVVGLREPGYEDHGPNFAAKCNAIGKVLGLAPVGVKGRDGLPDCAQWPLNVRPEGFYGEAPRATKAVAAATKTRAPRAPRAPKAAAPARSKVEQALDLIASMDDMERAMVRMFLQP